MFCQKCGKQIPDGAVFCNFCGAQQGVVAQAAPQAAPGAPPGYPGQAPQAAPAPPAQPAGTKDLKCASCGAPLSLTGGLAVITCEYCGTATSMGSGGWSAVQKHFMLTNALDQQRALEAGGKWLDQGLLRRNVAKNAELLEATLKYVPYWICPTTVTADIQGTRGGGQVQLQGGESGGMRALKIGLAIAGAAAASQNRNVSQPQPVRVRDRIVMNYQIPIVGVRGYTKFQPDTGYQFATQGKMPYNKKQTGGVETLDGDVTEQEAMQAAQAFAQKFVEKEARRRVDVLESCVPYFQQSPGELLHAPVWFVRYRHKGVKEMYILVDGNASKVIDGERPAVSLW